MAGNSITSTCSLMEGGCLYLRTCFTRLCGQRLGAMVGHIRTRESECFIHPAAEPGSWSLAPLEATVTR